MQEFSWTSRSEALAYFVSVLAKRLIEVPIFLFVLMPLARSVYEYYGQYESAIVLSMAAVAMAVVLWPVMLLLFLVCRHLLGGNPPDSADGSPRWIYGTDGAEVAAFALGYEACFACLAWLSGFGRAAAGNHLAWGVLWLLTTLVAGGLSFLVFVLLRRALSAPAAGGNATTDVVLAPRGVDFLAAIKSAWSKYAVFLGRSSRSEYWYWALFQFLFGFVASVLDTLLFGASPGLITLAVFLVFLLPGLAIAFRRLHDTGHSGWWLVVALIPVAGAIVLLVLYCSKGSAQPNRFGPATNSAAL